MIKQIAYEYIITIMLLTAQGDIVHVETNGITCEGWWQQNVKTHEHKIKVFRENHYYHTYKDTKVVGYVCSNNLPQ